MVPQSATTPPAVGESEEDDRVSAEHTTTDPHVVEEQIYHELREHTPLQFSSLSVRRIPNGVCLEGVVEGCDDSVDVNGLLRRICGAGRILNRLVVRKPRKDER